MSEDKQQENNDILTMQNMLTMQLIDNMQGFNIDLQKFTLGIDTISKALFDMSIFITRSFRTVIEDVTNGLQDFGRNLKTEFKAGTVMKKFGEQLEESFKWNKKVTDVPKTFGGGRAFRSTQPEIAYNEIRAGKAKGFRNAAGSLSGNAKAMAAAKPDPTLMERFKESFEKSMLGPGFKGNKLKEDFNFNMSGGKAGMQATQGFSLKNKLKSGFNSAMALPKLAGGVAKGVGSSMLTKAAALGPQMLALALVMKPVGALLEGIMEPLEPITELFGAVGQILGVLLVPIVNQIMRILLPILPILVDVIRMLLPVINFLILPLTFLGNLMQGLGPIIGMVTGVVATLFEAFQPLIDMLGENKGMMKLLEVAMAILSPIMTIVGGFVEILSGWITTLVNWIQDLADKISNAFGNPLDSLVNALNGNKDAVDENTAEKRESGILEDDFNTDEFGNGKNNMRFVV